MATEPEAIIIDEVQAEDVPEAGALWYSIPELAGGSSFDTLARIRVYTCDGDVADILLTG